MASLTKAVIRTINADKEIKVEAQFNPSELTIRHGLKPKKEKPVGASQKSQDDVSASASTEETTMNLSLYFDAFLMARDLANRGNQGRDTASGGSGEDSEWEVSSDETNGQFEAAVAEVSRCVHDLIRMARMNKDKHTEPQVQFSWGNGTSFTGYIRSVSTTYTLFDASGSPLRAKVDMGFVGEEDSLRQEAAQATPQSPDRTKERLMLETDQLWMLAHAEYGDASMWKTIARANGILNPRAVDRAVHLRLPSIR